MVLREGKEMTVGGGKTWRVLALQAGLIASEKKGRVRTVRLAPDVLAWVEQWVRRHRRTWERRLDNLGSFLKEENKE